MRAVRHPAVSTLAVVVLLLAATMTLRFRTTWHMWPWQTAGDRVQWCGQDYVRDGAASRTLEQVRAEDKAADVRSVDRYVGLGDRPHVWAAPDREARRTAAGWQPRKPRQPCASTVYLQVGDDRFTRYRLAGSS